MHLPLTLLNNMGGLPGLELQAVMSLMASFFGNASYWGFYCGSSRI